MKGTAEVLPGRITMLRVDTARFLPPLGLSVLLHVALAAYLMGIVDSGQPRMTYQREVTLTLERPFAPVSNVTTPAVAPRSGDPPRETLDLPATEKLPEDTEMEPSATRRDPVQGRSGRDRRASRGLNLTLPSGVAVTPVAPADGRVFDSVLLRTLNERRASATRASRVPIPGVHRLQSESRFSAGRWETSLRVGKLCFRVIEADPLQPLSTEQWYRVTCRD